MALLYGFYKAGRPVKKVDVIYTLMMSYRDYYLERKTQQAALDLIYLLAQTIVSRVFPRTKFYIAIAAIGANISRKAFLQDWTWSEMIGEIMFRGADLIPYFSSMMLFNPRGNREAIQIPLPISAVEKIFSYIGGSLVLMNQGKRLLEEIALVVSSVFAKQGYATAQYNLGWMYETGRGGLKSDKEAVKWYKKAAEQGDTEAQLKLGLLYKDGGQQRIPKNGKKSFLLTQASKGENELAKVLLFRGG